MDSPVGADGPRWRDQVDWWTDARLAYAAGLDDGYKLGRDHQDAVDDAEWRRTVRGLFAEEGHDSGRRDLDGRPLPSITAQIDLRRRFDRGPLGEYLHRRGLAS